MAACHSVIHFTFISFPLRFAPFSLHFSSIQSFIPPSLSGHSFTLNFIPILVHIIFQPSSKLSPSGLPSPHPALVRHFLLSFTSFIPFVNSSQAQPLQGDLKFFNFHDNFFSISLQFSFSLIIILLNWVWLPSFSLSLRHPFRLRSMSSFTSILHSPTLPS